MLGSGRRRHEYLFQKASCVDSCWQAQPVNTRASVLEGRCPEKGRQSSHDASTKPALIQQFQREVYNP